MTDSKLSRMEKFWILYDVANSAFILLATTIIPLYFNSIATADGLSQTTYLAYWGYATSIATLIVAIIGPIFGSASDSGGAKKKFFILFLMIGVSGTLLMAFPMKWILFLGLYVLTKVGFTATNIFYDAMLHDITSPNRMDRVSTHGYAWGYIGSVVPFILSLVIILKHDILGLKTETAMSLSFIITAIWWLLFSLPLLKNYKQLHYIESEKETVSEIFRRIAETLKNIIRDKKVLLFLIAFFFYIDGVYTIIDMAVAYGGSLGLDANSLLLALLLTQIVAFPCALIFAKLSREKETSQLIKICIIAYAAIAAFAIQLDKQWEFWVLAVAVGMFQGGIQALSRSYFAKIIPPNRSGEYFGIYDICGKGAAFLGTFLVSVITQITGKQNYGVSIIFVMFVAGFIVFNKAAKLNRNGE